MAMRSFADETAPRLLGQALSGSYTQVFEQKLATAERVVWLLIGHASVDVALNATIAVDSAGNSPTDLLTAAVDCDDAGEMWYLEVDAAQLTETKQYLSPKVTLTAGTYTLIEIKRGLRFQGDYAFINHHSTFNADESTSLVG